MRQLLILLWVFWGQMLIVFGIPSIFFIRMGDYPRLAVSGPLALVVLALGVLLLRKTRRDWHRAATG